MRATKAHPGSALALGLALLTAGLTSACGAAAEPVLPTPRPTLTASPEPSATPTRIFNASPTPTPVQPAAPATLGPSPTALMGALPTRSPRTLTPTLFMPVPGGLQIEYFTTSATNLKPGDKLTLFWSVKGVDKATIYRLDASGRREKLWNVGRSGSLDVDTRPGDRDAAQFLLTIGDATTHLDQSLSVPLTCSGQWFFEPQPTGCAPEPPTMTAEVQQPFERGLMIWVNAQSRVYVLFNDGQKPAWAAYPDAFKDGQMQSDPAIVPPAGMLQPIRGFGLVWRTRERVRERLGWATAAEQPFEGALQGEATTDEGVLYLRAKEGTVLALSGKGASWKLITP